MAARQIGVAKGTISKAIKTGKLSATRREDGSFGIDPSELARYLDSNRHRFQSGPNASSPPEPETDAQIALLREMLDEVRRDRDHWRAACERLVTSLPAPRRRWFGFGAA